MKMTTCVQCFDQCGTTPLPASPHLKHTTKRPQMTDAFSPSERSVLFTVQASAAVVNLACTVVLACILLFVILSLGGCAKCITDRVAGKGGFQSESKDVISSQATIRVTKSAMTPMKFCEIPVPVKCSLLCILMSFIASIAQNPVKFMRNADKMPRTCLAFAHLVLLFYALGKLANIAFLGARAELAYFRDNEEKKQFNWRKLVIVLTWIFVLCFLVWGVFAATDEYVVANTRILKLGLCAVDMPLTFNTIVNIVDTISSATLLLMFMFPLKSVVGEMKVGFHKAHKLEILMKENLLVGMIVAGFAFACVTAITVLESTFPVETGTALFAGCLRNVDLTANCVMQMYATRRYWGLKKSLSPAEERQKIAIEREGSAPFLKSPSESNLLNQGSLEKSLSLTKSAELPKTSRIQRQEKSRRSRLSNKVAPLSEVEIKINAELENVSFSTPSAIEESSSLTQISNSSKKLLSSFQTPQSTEDMPRR
jgi:hypothetical protein